MTLLSDKENNVAFSLSKLSFRNVPSILFLKIALFVSIILGFFIRINGIGDAPLAVDEYYMVKSVQNVLEYGLPRFDSGGYYSRGIIYQYILAFISLIWGAKVEISFRVVTIIINLLAIPALFKLGKKIGGQTVGYVAAIFFCFSLWEIEFARFIRMYALFQTVFIWYVYFLYLVVVENKFEYLKWMLILSFLSIFIYAGAIFLIVLNFLPLLFNYQKLKKSYILGSVILFVLAVLFIRIDFRHLGVENYLPPDVVVQTGTSIPIEFPLLLLQTLSGNFLWIILFVLLICISGAFLVRLFSHQNIHKKTKISFLLLILLSLLNLYGLIIIFSFIFLLIKWIPTIHFRSKRLIRYVAVILVNFGFWVFYVAFSGKWFSSIENLPSEALKNSITSQLVISKIEQLGALFSFNKFILLFFNYPQFYNKIVIQWLSAIPSYAILTALFACILLLFLLVDRKEYIENSLTPSAFLFTILLLMISGVAILNTPYNTTRYSFFFFPLIILLVISSIQEISTRISNKSLASSILFGVLTLFFLITTEDYNLHHLLNSGSKEVLLRMNYDKEEKRGHYYSRKDVKSPTEIVNRQSKNEDIILTTVIQAEYYLKKLDYFYIDHNSIRFSVLSIENGKKELWTNSKLLYKKDQLTTLLQKNQSAIWIIIDNPMEKRLGIESEIANRYKKYLYYQSKDKRINVYRIST